MKGEAANDAAIRSAKISCSEIFRADGHSWYQAFSDPKVIFCLGENLLRLVYVCRCRRKLCFHFSDLGACWNQLRVKIAGVNLEQWRATLYLLTPSHVNSRHDT